MIRSSLHKILAALFLSVVPVSALADKAANVNDIKTSIIDSNIVYPESFELDTRKMLEGWYLKNYTATDDRYARQGDTNPSDATVRERLAKLNTVIELPYNQIVRSYIDRYLVKGRAQVAALLGLSHYYMPIFEQALEEQGLPLELKYLPVIESGLNPNAVSKHGAAGLWQFMLATGKGLDMEVSSLVDERRDPYVSSQKAAAYLKTLHSTYGDWSLAIAAYNCGPGTVNKAIRRAGGDPKSHDFWSIYNFLPEETRGYVPMFIAANYVMNYYPYHNISPVLATKPLVTDTLMISTRVHFDQISKVLDIPNDELRVLNPQFRADIIPGRPERQYTLVLPSQQVQAYIMSEEDILAYEAEKYAQRTEVQPGDMAGEHSAGDLAVAETIVDTAPFEPAPVVSEAPVRAARSKGDAKTVTHKVAPGETLTSIAQTYGVSVDDLKKWNSLTRNSIRTGQQLRVTSTADVAQTGNAVAPAPESKSTAASAKAATDKTRSTAQNNSQKSSKNKKKQAEPAAPKSHVVKSGENLTAIAKKYGTSVAELQKANNMTGDQIRPGDNLKLPKGSKGAQTSNAKNSTSKKSKGARKKSRRR
ncbi:MAG: transglycosylase SLT domain-containing protein [Muribaculaceae bacterium]|nr:transglycosylase SLT domain-containing protein [Muribaculaceae bacterium]